MRPNEVAAVLSTLISKQFTVTEELVEDPKKVLKDLLNDAYHPSRGELFDEVDAAERIDLLEDLESRQKELEKNLGKALTGSALRTVVDAAVEQGILAETMYKRYIRIENEIHAFESEFETLYGLKIRFADDALQELVGMVLNGSEEALTVCRKIFQNYHHGLKLVMERTGSHEFTISKEAVRNPELYLNDMIQKTYRQNETDSTA